MTKPPSKPLAAPKSAPRAVAKPAAPKAQSKPATEPVTAPAIKHIAGKAMHDPKSVTPKEVQRLGASVEAHIEPRKSPKG